MKKPVLALFICFCMVLAFTACGESGDTTADDSFDVPFDSGTTDAVQIIHEDGTTETMTTKELVSLYEANGARFDKEYRDQDAIVVGVIKEINGKTTFLGGYEAEARLLLENGWEIEGKSADYVMDYNIGDVVACKGKISGVFTAASYMLGKDSNAPQIQLFK